MASHSPDGHDLFFPARGISVAGPVIVALYLSILVGSLFPIQLLNPAWQLKIGSALINASPFPLIGLGALHLAVVLAPADRLLRRHSRLAARLAVVVVIGFLLLIPLLSWAAISEQQQRANSQASLIDRANANLLALRQVVASASSGQELRERLLALSGPVLDAQAPARPLPALRAGVYGPCPPRSCRAIQVSGELLSPSNRRTDPLVRWRARSSTLSRRISRPWRSSRRRCCSFINDAISSTLSFIRITLVSAERMRSVTLMAGRPGQRARRPRPHPGSVLCGWC